MRSSTDVCLRNCASVRRQPGEQLVAEVLGHEPVVAGEARRHPPRRPPRPASTAPRGTGRRASPPSARSARELVASSSTAGGFQQHPRPPARPAEGRRRRSRAAVPVPASGRAAAAGASLLVIAIVRAGRHVLEQRCEHVQARPDWRPRADRRAPSTSGRSSAARRSRRGGTRVVQPDAPGPDSASNNVRRDRLDAVIGCRDVPQEHDGVVVSRVERDPRKRTRISLGPVREQGRLAVSGRRDHGRERHVRGAQPRDHVRLRHGAGPC